jgi:hypothetical protein
MGPEFCALAAAELSNSLRLAPDQNSFSKLSKDGRPAGNRYDHQKQHDHLDHEAGVQHELKDVEILVHSETQWVRA